MIDSYFRQPYQKIVIDPIVKRGFWNRVHPNTLTFLGGALGVLVFPTLFFGFPSVALVFLLSSGFLDTLDGSLARYRNVTSRSGAVLDITADRLVEFATILGLFAVDPHNRGWLCMGMLGSVLFCITTFLVVGIFTENTTKKGFYYSPGLMERAEAFLFFSLMIIFPSLFSILATLFMLMVSWTASIRLQQFIRNEDGN